MALQCGLCLDLTFCFPLCAEDNKARLYRPERYRAHIYIYIYTYIECDSTRKGGRGGEGGRGERGGRVGEWEGGKGTRIWVLPSHRQPKSIQGGETSPPDLGAHLWVHTEGPPLPHNGALALFRGWGEAIFMI